MGPAVDPTLGLGTRWIGVALRTSGHEPWRHHMVSEEYLLIPYPLDESS